ncbi:hypothetical protein [Aeromonas salmonicida]|uniref:hypothetical protein n=1 Tax=Aeromonas salmonicida TaxID=645 RepID=UPI000ABC8B71|nr:hypothetical protein [Aeromonas salmonicida]MDE7529121.1 hypothetical protein [Aeromonas salmonicida]MDE7533456.1 hypothetical protein [Aeromonas salmonicida]
MEHNHVAPQTDRRGDPRHLVTELINEEDLLTIANQIARQKLAKGIAITDKYLLQ